MNHLQTYLTLFLDQMDIKPISSYLFHHVCECVRKEMTISPEDELRILKISNSGKLVDHPVKQFVDLMNNSFKHCSDRSNKRIVLLVGSSGAGKSTYVENNYQINDDTVVCSRDNYIMDRFAPMVEQYDDFDDLYHQCWKMSTILKIDSEFQQFCEQQVKTKSTIIVDMTNLTVFSRRKWVILANRYKANVSCVYFNVDKETCIASQIGRDKTIHPTIIDDMFFRLEFPLFGFECNDVEIITRKSLPV